MWFVLTLMPLRTEARMAAPSLSFLMAFLIDFSTRTEPLSGANTTLRQPELSRARATSSSMISVRVPLGSCQVTPTARCVSSSANSRIHRLFSTIVRS